jgi:hypothetical protein
MNNLDEEKPTVNIKAAGYENIYFDCPHCGLENIINRTTDLSPPFMVSGMDMKCQNHDCGSILWLNSDKVQLAKYHWFLQELPILKDRKLYRDYALTLCQGAESFFLQAIINKKFDREPKYRSDDGRIDMHNYLSERSYYEQEIKDKTFNPMRNLFLETFKSEFKQPSARISRLKEDKREWAFTTIKNSTINKLRNEVAHKNAYRPKLSEIEAHDELVMALQWLGIYLHVLDPNFARSRLVTE